MPIRFNYQPSVSALILLVVFKNNVHVLPISGSCYGCRIAGGPVISM